MTMAEMYCKNHAVSYKLHVIKLKMLSFYIIFRSRLLVVTMAEMYCKNHAVSYKLHVIKQTVNTINCNEIKLCDCAFVLVLT